MFLRRSLNFDSPDLATAVERLSIEALDNLPFGAVLLSPEGLVRFYSRAEARLSGFGDRSAVGLNFFSDIALCTNTPEFRGRIEQAMRAGRMDIEFGHVGDFTDPNRLLRVRALSASPDGYWMFLQRG